MRPDPEESRENTAGIITPANEEREQRAIGTVEAVGVGIEDIKEGDRVIYGAFGGETIKLSDAKEDERKLLFEEDILAFIDEE